MSNISKTDIDALVQLQEAETQIVKIKAVLQEIEKVKVKLGSQLKQFSTALAGKQEQLASVSKAGRDLEREIGVIDERIIKSNETLRMVKSNKEYQVLLREVDDNKKRKDGLETELLKCFDEKEQLEAQVNEYEAEYRQLKERITAEQDEIDKKSSDDRKRLDEFMLQQDDVGKYLTPFLKNQFTKISKMNQGLAVINVKNEICMGCFMNIPPQLYIEVQRADSLILCPQCSRILFYMEEESV